MGGARFHFNIAAELFFPYAVGTCCSSSQRNDSCLGTGLGVRLALSSAGSKVNADSQVLSTHSTYMAPSRTFPEKLRCGGGVQKGAESIVWVGCTMGGLEEFLQVFLEGVVLLLKAQQVNSRKVRGDEKKKQKTSIHKRQNSLKNLPLYHF